MKLIKFLLSILLLICSFYIGSKGFSLPNSAAAEICFGFAGTMLMAALIIFVNIE